MKLTVKDLPPELKEIQKTYLVLQRVRWGERYPEFPFYSGAIHPIAVIVEARKKNLSVPARLLKLIGQRYQNELEEQKKHEEIEKQEQEQIAQRKEKNADNKKSIPEQSLSSRERKNLLKAIGVLVHLLMDEKAKSTRSNRGAKLSALQVSQMMLEKAEHLDIEIEGLKSFDRKITEALELFLITTKQSSTFAKLARKR